ncbi:MAG: hypothetical protein GX600_00575 [Dehalococcoidia bacterium]|jgi:hypothetical protein|nr:hypothetical protein [Dehalococcoidia bacterium]
MQRIIGWFRSGIAVVRRHRRAYLIINLVYYGIVLAAMVFVTAFPAIQQALTDAVLISFSEEPLAAVVDAYASGNVFKAAMLTFAVNLFLGAILVLLLPSLIIPFSGLLMGLIRATLWGLLLAPTTPELQMAMIPHSLCLLLEGQGYILTLLAAWTLGCAFVSPTSVGATTRLGGYLQGLKGAGWVMLLAAAVLAVAAVYEAVEVIHLVPLLSN